MKLATFIPPTEQPPEAVGWTAYPAFAGEVRGDEMVSYDEGVTVTDLISRPSPPAATGPSFALSDVRLCAPLRPRAILGIGLNYADHAAETGRDAPEFPIVFMKLSTSSTPPNGAIKVPSVIRRLDYEGELAVVMGNDGEVAGYAVADDLSARDLQGREPQWTRAKGFDNSCPWGPWITTAEEVGDPHDLALKTWVNGELRQDGSTADLIFGVPRIVEFLAETCTLQPGDIILTGTPAGVGIGMDPKRFLQSGDVVRIEIERLGAIEHAIA